MRKPVNIIWFRRDLRLTDNAALYYALKDNNPVVPVFIFDKHILGDLDEQQDRRVEFIYEVVLGIGKELKKLDSFIEVFFATPQEAFKQLIKKYTIEKVFKKS